jgi:cytochrome d ubiquinol oxidase subunit II
MQLDIVPLWTLIIGFAVFMYVLLDGFDLGVGILFPLMRNEDDRSLAMNSVAPIWDGNETWLVLGGVALLAVFPVAFAVIIPAVYFPIQHKLLGLKFPGVAFQFRMKTERARPRWNRSFFLGSFVATYFQGVVLGAFIEGFEVRGRVFAGTSLDWIQPFPLLTGLGLLFGYTLLGATWLVMKTEGELQQWARRRAVVALYGVIAFIAMVSVWTPLAHARIAERWFSFPNLLYLAPVPIITALIAVATWRGLHGRADAWPFVGAMGLFAMAYAGLLVSIVPYIVPYAVTLWDAASSPSTQAFLLIGTLFLLPIILTYLGWSYYVFRGKVRAGVGYH